MVDESSLEGLIAQIDILSLRSHLADSGENLKKQNDDLILGIVWSDDENNSIEDIDEPEKHDNLHRTGRAGTYLEENPRSSLENKENISPYLNTYNSHVTIRKRLKKKHFKSGCSESGANDLPDVSRTLSYGDDHQIDKVECSGLEQKKNSTSLNIDEINYNKLNKTKDKDESSTALNSSVEKDEKCLSVNYNLEIGLMEQRVTPEINNTLKTRAEDSNMENNFVIDHVNGLILREKNSTSGDEKISQNEKRNMSQDFMLNSKLSITCTSDVIKNGQTESIQNSERKKSEIILYDNVQESLLHTSVKKTVLDVSRKTSVTCRLITNTDSSGSDYDSVWEHDDPLSNLKKTECEKQCTSSEESVMVNKVVEKGKQFSNRIPEGGTPEHVQPDCKLKSSDTALDSSSSDDEFEAFLTEIKTPKLNKNARCTPSMESFIVDDWIVSSDEEEIPPLINRITGKLKTPTSKKIPSLDRIVEKYVVSSDEEERPSLSKIKLLNHQEQNIPTTTKESNTPKPKKTPLKKTTLDKTRLKTSSVNGILTPYLNTSRKFWRKSREQLSSELFRCYNETIFENKLPHDMLIIWNKQMTKTAGFCYYIGSSMGRKCRIELSEKVVDSCERIRDTLIHELCHAATWLIDGIKAGHGPHWKRWAFKARSVHSDLPPISRCHSYEINYKFNYRCVRCHHRFGRHSKSINLKTSRCPYCLSPLELLPKLKKDGTPAKPRAPSKFSLFVKDNYGKIKEHQSGSSHQQIMKELSKRFAETLNNKDKDNT